ncbi:MAG: O-antigen ligase family protein [Armatimonadetes bacterium]|nr:O-antigen ligase family protein [Armatimonadota bacterium]
MLFSFVIADISGLRRLRSVLGIVGLLYIGMVALMHGLPTDSSWETSRLNLGTAGTTIGASLLMCLFGINMAIYALSDGISVRMRALSGTICLVCVAYAIATGSRGPLLSLAAAMIAYVFVSSRNLAKTAVTVVVIAAMVAGGWQLLPKSRGLNRIEAEFASPSNRMPYVAKWRETPLTLFGSGIGSFAIAMGGSRFDYPHNILVELYYEHGICGLLVCMAPFLASFSVLVAKSRAYASSEWHFVVALCAFYCMESLFSNSFLRDEGLALGVGLAVSLVARDCGPPHDVTIRVATDFEAGALPRGGSATL